MATANVFGGEVARLEDELVAAKRALGNAERQSGERADQLRAVRNDLAAAEKTVEGLMRDLEDTRSQLDQARGFAGRVSAAETAASDQSKRAAKAESEAERLDFRLAVTEGELGDTKGKLAACEAENRRLGEEVAPARALAAAVQAGDEAAQQMLEAAKQIRPHT